MSLSEMVNFILFSQQKETFLRLVQAPPRAVIWVSPFVLKERGRQAVGRLNKAEPEAGREDDSFGRECAQES